MKKHPTLLPLLITLALLAIVAFSLATTPATAGELPPRPPTPTPSPTPPSSTDIEGAPLILQPTGEEEFPDDAWTVVQWQTALGDWVDVDGWRSEFNPAGYVLWWVGPRNFEESPFRWLVYDGQERTTLLAISDEFALPEHSDDMVIVPVAVGDGLDP